MRCDKNHTFKIISLLIVLFFFTIHCFLPGDKGNIDNKNPVAYGQNVSTCVNTPVTINLQADDSDSEKVSWSISTNPQHGSIIEGFPQIVYTPATDFTGTDSFTFQASDGALLSNNAEIIINVGRCTGNESPVAYGQNVSTCVNTPVTINLQADDSDSEIVSWSISTNPQHGTITESFPQIVYIPATDFTGTDTFTFQVSDGALLSNNVEIIVNVVTCDDTPVFQDDFSTKDSNWYWRIDGSAVSTLVTSGVELKVLAAADTSTYSNAEFYESAGRLPWLRCRAVFRLQSPSIQLGSRGWGFWNDSMNMSTSVIAWFTRVGGTGSAVPAGFYASTQSYGNAPVMTEITGVDLSQWHEFEVNWKADFVVYSIDGNVVVTHFFSPDRNMRLDVWTDNSVYDSSWAHVYQDPSADSTLIVDWIKVY